MDRNKALALLLLFGDSDEGDQGTSKRSCWVREQLARRHEHGEFATWFAEEKLNAGAFHAFFRMTPDRFEEILEVIAPHIQHKRTNCRDPIPVAERLAMTLRLVPVSADSCSQVMAIKLCSRMYPLVCVSFLTVLMGIT